MNRFPRFQGVIFTVFFIWGFVFMAGPAIDDVCVITKVSQAGVAIDKKGHVISYPKGTRLVRSACSEFSRGFFLRDVAPAKALRKAVGAQ